MLLMCGPAVISGKETGKDCPNIIVILLIWSQNTVQSFV